jgi:peroxiredoxin
MALAIGDEAPNFDLSSTEGVLLMLRDEVIQRAAVLYFFANPGAEIVPDRVVRDLVALSNRRAELARARTRILAVSPTPLDRLKKLQVEHKLLYPLLHDDRAFSAAYGVAAEDGAAPEPALVVVSREQKVLWQANPTPAAGIEGALPEIVKLLRDLPSPAKGYPKSVVNKLIDRWVN